MATDAKRQSVFVGRERELALLVAAVESTEPTLRVVALDGEPGVGKSRLLQELSARVTVDIIRGDALDDADGGGPYRLLGSLLPDSGMSVVDEEAAFERITENLASRGVPAALVLDDVQWAAPTGWRALSYVVRAQRDTALTIVLSGRPDFLEPGAPGARLLDELNRDRRLQLIRLQPLERDEVRRLARRLAASALAPDAEARLLDLSGGNPFFIEELLRAGADLDATPPTLRLAIAHRLERLPAEVRTLLEAGSVFGRTFSTERVAAVTGLPGANVKAELEQAARAAFLNRSADTWTFRHDSVRETAYELASGKAGLHLRAARALAATDPAGDVARTAAVAGHFKLGGDSAEAGAWSLRAAREAMAAQAPLEAMAHARTSAELLAADADRAAGARLLQAEAAIAAGEFASAEPILEALVSDPGRTSAHALLLLGRLSRRREDTAAAAAHLQGALAAADGGRLAAEALVELAGLDGLARGRFDEAEANAQRAIDIATPLGDAGLEARALLALASSRARRLGPEGQADLLRQALARAEAAADLVTATEAAASLANVHYWMGELGASTTYARRRLQLAAGAGDVFALRHTHSWLALLAVSRGEWVEAERLVAAARPGLLRLQSPEPIAFLEVVEGVMRLRRGDANAAHGLLAQALARLEGTDPAAVIWYAGLLALAALDAGRPAEAAARSESQEERLAGLPQGSLPARSARNVLALVYARLQHREQAAACEEALRPYSADFHWWPVRRSLAEVAALRGDVPTAIADLDIAEELCRREGLQPDLEAIADTRARLGSHALRANEAGLSRREIEVLALVAAGCTNREIAERLFLSERTVVNHVTHILNKLGTDNRAGATAAAMRLGIVR